MSHAPRVNPWFPSRPFPAKVWLEARRASGGPAPASKGAGAARPTPASRDAGAAHPFRRIWFNTPEAASPGAAIPSLPRPVDLTLLLSSLAPDLRQRCLPVMQAAAENRQRYRAPGGAPAVGLCARYQPQELQEGGRAGLRGKLAADVQAGLGIAALPLAQLDGEARNIWLVRRGARIRQVADRLACQPQAAPLEQELRWALGS